MTEASTALIEEVAEKLRRKAAPLDPIGGKVLLDCGEQSLLIEGEQSPIEVRVTGQEPADCRVRLKLELLNDILDGRKKAFMAFATGRIGISGDMSVAIKLKPILAGGA